jgi:subtilisin family serine protease
MRRGNLQLLVATVLLVAATTMVTSPAGADQTRDDQWHLSSLDVARAHELSQGEGITVAVIDTGVDGNHPDLEGNVVDGVDLVASGNGWEDIAGHGTAMAGLIAAHGHGEGNAEGALGIAPRAKILPIRILTENDSQQSLTHYPLAEAIDEAVRRGADIISISMEAGPGSLEPAKAAIEAGVVVVAASGNRPRDERPDLGADGVVLVGALGPDGVVADISVRGNGLTPLWLTAPGVDIVSTALDHGYRQGTGTSPATAIVSGAVALVWSQNPQLSGADVVDHLVRTSVDKGSPGQDPEYGFGELNVVAALETDRSQTTTTLEDISAGLPPGLEEKLEREAAAKEAEATESAGSDDERSGGLLVGAGAAVLVAVVLAVVLGIKRRRPQP